MQSWDRTKQGSDQTQRLFRQINEIVAVDIHHIYVHCFCHDL